MTLVVVLATRSEGKVRELAALLATAGIASRSLDAAGVREHPDEAGIECHESFEENALAKARYFAGRCGGLPVLAEDSGLTVDALGGAPGVRSRRWSGRADLAGTALDEANNLLLLQALSGVTNRRATYTCAAVLCAPAGEWAATGECRGRILHEPEGAGGFGYDPWFFSDDLGMSFGLAPAEAKAAVSHRGRAVRALLALVPSGR